MDFFQQVVLGIAQGITEWIPISSEGVIIFLISNFFSSSIDVELFIRQALFLHLGTFFAALIYFRKEVKELLKGALKYNRTDPETRKTLRFLFIATLTSGIVGLAIINFLDLVNINELPLTSSSVNFLVGFLLLITGFVQLKVRDGGYKRQFQLTDADSLILGLLQGVSALPGLSRSGLTVSGFLFRKFDETVALRLSFLMSLPIVLIGNVLLNFDIAFIKDMFFGCLLAFFFGLMTIHILMKFSEKVKFGHFAIMFGLLAIIAGFVNLYY
ncbi:undecaprenyl-diphosphate phosphatase [Candidatus Pacearchaeota archaeon]|nr:undecaprenyl-diphosphate phosphatase [Candidatus Pacearchaeota archaeon]